MYFRRSVAALALLVSVAAVSLPAQQAPTFRAGVTLVTTDVIARDGNGRFVPDLTKDSFTILEDGVAQTITSFALVLGGRTFSTLAPAPIAAPEGIVLPTAPRRQASETGRVFVIFVDDLHFEAEYSPHVRRLVQTIAETLMHEGDLVAMVSSGPSNLEIAPTYDRKVIAAAVSKIRGSAMTPAQLFQLLETSQGPGDLRQNAQVAFQAAYTMVSSLDQVQNRRKAVIFISTGYNFDPFAESRKGADRIQGGRFAEPTRFLIDQENPYFRLSGLRADADLYAYMRELTLTANRVNATLFTIDPRGLAGIVDAGQALDQSEWRTHLQKTQSSLRYLAEETGGMAVVNDNDFAAALKRIDAETSDYYVIGYSSTNADPARRVRQIEVKVNRPDVSVSARRAYSLKTAGTPGEPRQKP
jgi:VWFA-related protein